MAGYAYQRSDYSGPGGAPLGTAEGSVPFWAPGALSEDWSAQGTAWDWLILGGRRVPGIVKIDGGKGTKIDIKKSPGTDGASATNMGTDPGTITVRIRLWTQQQLDEWAEFVPLLQAKAGKKKPEPLQAEHPALAINGITALYLKHMGLVSVQSPGGPAEVVVQFVEHAPVKKTGIKLLGKPADITKIKTSFGPPDHTPPSATNVGP